MSAKLKTERTLSNTSAVAVERLARMRVRRRAKELEAEHPGQAMSDNIRNTLVVAEVMSISQELSNHHPENGLTDCVRSAHQIHGELSVFAL